MRNLLGFVILGILAIASAARAEMVPIRSITVSGVAERQVAPDEAHLNITLGATNMKMADAKTSHDAKLKKLFTITDKNGIDRKHLSTQSSSTQPHYTYTDGKQVFTGYRVQTSIDIKLADITKTGAMIEQIMTSGLEEHNQQEYGQFLSTSYTIANPDTIRDDLLAAAIANARSKADRMAAAVNETIGRVYQINEGNVTSYEPRVVMAEMKVASDGIAQSGAYTPPPGEQEMRSTVSVVFELKN